MKPNFNINILIIFYLFVDFHEYHGISDTISESVTTRCGITANLPHVTALPWIFGHQKLLYSS